MLDLRRVAVGKHVRDFSAGYGGKSKGFLMVLLRCRQLKGIQENGLRCYVAIQEQDTLSMHCVTCCTACAVTDKYVTLGSNSLKIKTTSLSLYFFS